MANSGFQNLDLRKRIEAVLTGIKGVNFSVEARNLLAVLGYESERILPSQTGKPADFLGRFPAGQPSGKKSEMAFLAAVSSVRLLFQYLGEEEASEGGF